MIQAFDGYAVTDTLVADDDFVLARGRRTSDCGVVLLRYGVRTDTVPGGAAGTRLEREYALRADLDAAWAAMPRQIVHGHGRAALVFDDTGLVPLSVDAAMHSADFLRQAAAIALATSQMHRRLLAHQDLKPANILVDPRGGPVLLIGFGMAERIKHCQDTRCDLYCLGVILHQMLTGALPFASSSGAPDARAFARNRGAVDPVCKAIVQKLLATSAEQRYQSASGLYADLQQCRAMLEGQGRIDPFVLGCHDGAARVRIPQRLVGRAEQLAALDGALRDAARLGTPELLLLAGHAGTGKTALLKALQRSAAAAGATVVAGKFDQMQRDIPYATLGQAFQGMVRQRLAQGDAMLAAWRFKLMAALGHNASLMLELIPELKFVIGEHAPPPPLPPREAQNRFESVFRKFLAVCCGPESVLLLCLDDLQWIDPASLKLLTHLLTHPGVRHVLMVGAYRASAVGLTHPAALARDSVREQGTRVREITLQALGKADCAELVAASLSCQAAAVAPLSALVYSKTAGNPYFTLQFLADIGEAGLLRYDEARGAWDWDAQAIGAKSSSENVADLLVARLHQLPPGALDLVKLLACLGTEARLETIALVSGMSLLETDECLWPVARMGLMAREPDCYRFLHDRVREGAYSMMPPASLPERHLHIGRLLLSSAAPEALEQQLFGVVHHLNLALPAIGDKGELRRLARLNVRAGDKARNAVAYDSARDYYSLAAGLTPTRAWQNDFDATFTLYLALAECEYLCGHLERAGRLFELLVEQSRTRVDLARVALLRIALYQVSGRIGQAAACALEALGLFGVTFPESEESIAAALETERAAIGRNMKGRSVAALLDEPASVDPEVAIVCELFADMGSSVFSARPELYSLLAAKALNFTLRYGSTDTSCMTYSRYAILLVSLGAMPDAFAFSDLAVQLAQRSARSLKRSGRLRFVHGAYIHSWREPIAGSVIQLEQSFQACLDAGDVPHAGYAAHIATWNRFEAGCPLHEVVQSAQHYQVFARQQRNDPLLQLLRCYEQMVHCLQGSTSAEGGFDDAGFRVADAIAVFEQAGFGAAKARLHLMEQVVAFTFGRDSEALAAAEAAAAHHHFFLASVNDATHHFYHALTIASVFRDAPRQQQEIYLAALRDKQEKLRTWAGWCADNFQNRYLLVTAELARLQGRNSEAMRCYERAISAAAAAGFVQNEALACELAANFSIERGADASDYLRRALRAWRAWGAHGKVRQLQRRFPGLAGQPGAH